MAGCDSSVGARSSECYFLTFSLKKNNACKPPQPAQADPAWDQGWLIQEGTAPFSDSTLQDEE